METLDSYDTFGVYLLTPIWCVCLTVIIGFYGRIFLLVRAHGRKIFDKGSLPPPDKKKEDTKHKKEETKTNIKNDAEKQQTIDSDNFQKLSCVENPLVLHPTSFGTDIYKPELATEISRETKVTFIDELSNEAPHVLEVIGEPNDHQPTSEESSSPSNNEEDGAIESSTHQDADGEVSVRSTSEEGGVEPNVQQDVAAESSQPSVKREDGEEDPKDQDNTSETLPPSAAEKDGTVVSSTSQDTTEETSSTSGNGGEGAEEQSAPQEAAAPQEEEEVAGAVCIMPSLAQRERGNTKKESKLAKRSGYIIFTFLIFWIPLIATVVLNHSFYQNDNLKVSFKLIFY